LDLARNREHADAGSPKVRTKNNFDSMRLVLAILVIFSHAFPIARGSNATEPLFALTGGQTTIGDLSVWGFFVIGGNLIAQSWLRSSNPWSYLKHRVARIYPGFIVLSCLSVLIVVPLLGPRDELWRIGVGRFLTDTMRLLPVPTPSIFRHNPTPNVLNGSLWSIHYEFWCYFFILISGMCGFLRYRAFLVALLFEFIAWSVYLRITGWRPGGKLLGEVFGYPALWATVLPFFLAGALFHLYGGAKLVRKRYAVAALAVVILSYFVPYGPQVALPTVGAYALLALAYAPRLNFLRLGRYGDFSFGVYLYAFPIEQILEMKAHGNLTPWDLFVLAVPITLGMGALSWFGVEKRFLSRAAQLKHEGLAT